MLRTKPVIQLAAREPLLLSNLEEILGVLHSVENKEVGLVAAIGEIHVLLPGELFGKLQGLIGRRIGILRLDGYHIRDLEGKDGAQEDRLPQAFGSDG